MNELSNNRELTMYSSGVPFIESAVAPPQEYVDMIAKRFLSTIKESHVRLYLFFSQVVILSFLPLLVVQDQAEWTAASGLVFLP